MSAPFDLIAALNAPFERAIAALPKPTNPQPSLLPYLTPSEACQAQAKAIEAALEHIMRGRIAEAQNVLHDALEACEETLADMQAHES